MADEEPVGRDSVELEIALLSANDALTRLDRVSPHDFPILISILPSYSLFTTENEMSVMPASAQAFIACET